MSVGANWRLCTYNVTMGRVLATAVTVLWGAFLQPLLQWSGARSCNRCYSGLGRVLETAVTVDWGAFLQPLLQWTGARSCNRCYSGKAISITYCQCVFIALVIRMQCACAILSIVACPALQCFSTLSHKRRDFRRKKLLNIKCVFLFPIKLLCETFLILRSERDMIKNVAWSSCKVRVILVRF